MIHRFGTFRIYKGVKEEEAWIWKEKVCSLLNFRAFVFRQKNISGRVTVPVGGESCAAENIRNPGSVFLLFRREGREAGGTYVAFAGLEPSL